MTWIKIDDGFADHPKVVGLSGEAVKAFIAGLCYCARHLTDGHISQPAVEMFAKPKVTDELLSCGLWERNDGGILVHDYLEFQPSRSETEANRLQRASAGRNGGARSGEARRKRTAAALLHTKVKQT